MTEVAARAWLTWTGVASIGAALGRMLGLVGVLLHASSAALSGGCNRHCTEAPQPQALSVSPRKGPAHGGHSIRIEGLGLGLVSAVQIIVANHPPASCGGLRIVADNMISCTTGSVPAAGEGQIRLWVPCQATAAEDCVVTRLRYDYVAVTLREVSPDGGPPAGGTQITVRGANFDLNQLRFTIGIGNVPCANVRIENTEVLTCTTGAVKVPREQLSGEPTRVEVGFTSGEHAESHSLSAEPSANGHPTFTCAPRDCATAAHACMHPTFTGPQPRLRPIATVLLEPKPKSLPFAF